MRTNNKRKNKIKKGSLISKVRFKTKREKVLSYQWEERSCLTIFLRSFRFFFQSLYYPEQAGYPIGASDSPKQYMMEMHYDNPKLIEGIFRT